VTEWWHVVAAALALYAFSVLWRWAGTDDDDPRYK
jgi:hypothetical protein